MTVYLDVFTRDEIADKKRTPARTFNDEIDRGKDRKGNTSPPTFHAHMARLSKAHHFKIFQDTGIPTPPGDQNDPFNDIAKSPRSSTKSNIHLSPTENDSDDELSSPEDEAHPRDSLTSVSTFPDSNSQQHEKDEAAYTALPPASPQKFFTPQIIRPSFRRPESVRRMQMTSPRQSILSYHRSSRSGTPHSDFGRGSPRGRRRITEESTSASEDEVKDEDRRAHPLVLLHVTLLPITLPWSMGSMKELLPPQVLENLQLLRSKVSETVLQRGILIPHPREEYEILEERLLEALELKEERVTKCGHYLPRLSNSSTGSASDSGLGSSADGSEDGDRCAVCRHHIHCTAGKKQKWSVKVFAANGLMRNAAWSAAWNEMESVDVEVLPWISEEDRRKLDQRMEEAEREERMRRDEETIEIQGMTGMIEIDGRRNEESGQARGRVWDGDMLENSHALVPISDHCREPRSKSLTSAEPDSDLPPVYRASQLPLSVLLRNYCFLLAQDRRNVAMFFLGMLTICFAIRALASSTNTAVVTFDQTTFDTLPVVSQFVEAAAAEVEIDDIPGVREEAGATTSAMPHNDEEAHAGLDDPEAAPRPEEPQSNQVLQPVDAAGENHGMLG